MWGDRPLLPWQPSCENMLLDIKNRLQASLPPPYRLCRLMLAETENSYAEWYASDNESKPLAVTESNVATGAKMKTDRYARHQC